MDCWPCEYLRTAYTALYQDDDLKIMRGLGENTWGYYAIWRKHTGRLTPNEKRYLMNMLKQYGTAWADGSYKLEGTSVLGAGHFHYVLMPTT